MLGGRLTSCQSCAEKHSRFRAWTCANCDEPVLERLSTTLLRVLFWKKLVDAGYPLHKTDLDPFELWLFALIKETDDERE